MSRSGTGPILAMLLGIAGVWAQGTQDPQFRGAVNTVPIYATVVDANGRLVPNLTRDDFQIFDDGRPQALTEFANSVQPITVVLMLDRSVSLEANFALERDAAEAFVVNLGPSDRARIGSFNALIRLDPVGFTSDRDELIRILHLDLLDGGLTPLWNATTVAMNTLEHEKGRRIVLLFSDGDNNPGLPGRQTVSYGQVRDQAQADGIMIYAVGLNDGCEAPGGRPLWQRGPTLPLPGGGPDGGGKPPAGPGGAGMPVGPDGRPIGGPGGPGISIPIGRLFGNGLGEARCSNAKPRPELRDLAADGGGGYLELHGSDDLSTIFAALANELHHQYLLGFSIATLDGRTHLLDVRTKDPKLTVRARRSYLAAAK